MYVLELAITKKYWEPTQEYLLSYIRRGRWDWVDGKGVIIRIDCSKNMRAYAVCNYLNGELTPVGWIWLVRKSGWVSYEVQQTFVMPAYRGNRYAEKLYMAAVNTDGLLLTSGCSHTKHSSKLWARLVAKETFNIWAQDLKNLSRTSQVYAEQGKVQGYTMDIYHPPFQRQDVRLIAQRKRK